VGSVTVLRLSKSGVFIGQGFRHAPHHPCRRRKPQYPMIATSRSKTPNPIPDLLNLVRSWLALDLLKGAALVVE
jgi:hypothetical protein